MSTKRRYFGTDGVRATVGTSPMTPDFVMLLGQAAGRVFARHCEQGRPTVLIGKDTRVSGYMLESALEAGFSSAGVNVILCGPIPTPAVAYLTRALRVTAGVVISASHNPFTDNGIKFFSGQGKKFPDEVELEIEAELDKGFSCQSSDNLGKVQRLNDAAGRYIEFCKSSFPRDLDLRGMKLYLDCANGAAYQVAPAVFREIGAEVVVDANQPDGFNINREVGATHTDTLAQRTREAGCDIGLAFDGDADRLIMSDREKVYNGDAVLYVIAKGRNQIEPVSGVVGTLMTNYALEKRFAAMGIGFARAKVGDRYVLEELNARGWLLGGESSGHTLVLDQQTTGDGIVTALQVLAILRRNAVSLGEFTSELKLYPQTLVNRRISKDYDWQSDEVFMRAVANANQAIEGKGRVLIRASGTEPLVRVMVEAEDGDFAKALAEKTANALKVCA